MKGNGIEVRQSSIEGRGVFATREFVPGETVHVMEGERLTRTRVALRVALGRLRRDDPLQLDRYTYLAPDELSVAFNHTCEPNCGLRGERELFALGSIRPGDELTFDYSLTVWPNLYTRRWRLECRCGSPQCRRTIGNLAALPPAILERYLAAGALQDSVRRWVDARLQPRR